MYDNFYSIKDYRIKKLLQKLQMDGFEIGYHGSFNSCKSYMRMKQEKGIMDSLQVEYEYGVRQHYLRFKVPYTWRIQEKVSLLYDTSLGYADCEGFRCGICFPFKPYDVLNNREMNIWEIPLIVMEGTLKDCKYRGLHHSLGFERVHELIKIVEDYQGVFSLLWHNSSLSGDSKGWDNMYGRILNQLSKHMCWGGSGRELIKHINKY